MKEVLDKLSPILRPEFTGNAESPEIDNTAYSPDNRTPLLTGNDDNTTISDKVCQIVEQKPTIGWWMFFLLSFSVLGLLGVFVPFLIFWGVGTWGVNNPVGWGYAIVNFVFWIGIGHAGTLISAILFLFRQKWRTSINRAAEAMTIFAVICAGMFPGIHVGRAWFAYWMFPIPNQMELWPNFRSPLVWDVFAVGTYFTVSLMFWYMGMIPDLATLRDRAKHSVRKFAYGILAMGWTGSHRHWHVYERAYLLLAALATPLVLSVHSVVSFDFAVSQVAGWHSTIFPPYFVAGAIFSGFAMVMTLLVPARQFFGLKDVITLKHLENMNKIIMLTGMIVGYSYAQEFFIAWYSGVKVEKFAFINRAFGQYAWAYWIMVSCNVLSPQIFWFKKMRTSIWVMFIVSILVNIGMWFERFVIVVTSLANDYTTSAWDYYTPKLTDVAILLGAFGLFFTLFALFCRFMPFVAMSELRGVLAAATPATSAPSEQSASADTSAKPTAGS
ncbi:MAG: NrfD/PsrC family molybdoenzyme membrane anchor subunit [Planctomycetota bacterium]